MEKSDLLIRYFRNLPSPAEFATIEERDVPAVFEGCIRDWPAYNLWNPCKGGLQRLKHLAGPATVQVMATTSGSNFYGDIRGHERVPISFVSFLDLADRSSRIAGVSPSSTEMPEELALMKSLDLQFYLAQAGIYSQESTATSDPLSPLRKDIDTPSFLQSSVSSINLWMSVNGSRSSTHYDPYHNLLCIVSGCKEVKLWPPSAALSLYPLPIFGEASNHSGVDFANPDFTKYPRFLGAMQNYQSVTLRAGDVLFLPEGWYHQVNSEAVTIAVNFWWPSKMSLKLGTHMDAYLLRRLLANLLDCHKEQTIENFSRNVGEDFTTEEAKLNSCICPDNVQKTNCLKEPSTSVVGKNIPANGEGKSWGSVESSAPVSEDAEDLERYRTNVTPQKHVSSKQKPKNRRQSKHKEAKGVKTTELRFREKEGSSSLPLKQIQSAVEEVVEPIRAGADENSHKQKVSSKSLADFEIQALRTLVLSVSDMTMGGTDRDVETSKDPQGQNQQRSEEPIARVFASLDPPSLQRTLLVMSMDYPRTFEALILHKLSPLAAEILTRKFEAMDSDSGLDWPQEEFYAQIYSVFDNPGVAMASLVDGKESFAAMSLKQVMDWNLGIQVDTGRR